MSRNAPQWLEANRDEQVPRRSQAVADASILSRCAPSVHCSLAASIHVHTLTGVARLEALGACGVCRSRSARWKLVCFMAIDNGLFVSVRRVSERAGCIHGVNLSARSKLPTFIRPPRVMFEPVPAGVFAPDDSAQNTISKEIPGSGPSQIHLDREFLKFS